AGDPGGVPRLGEAAGEPGRVPVGPADPDRAVEPARQAAPYLAQRGDEVAPGVLAGLGARGRPPRPAVAALHHGGVDALGGERGGDRVGVPQQVYLAERGDVEGDVPAVEPPPDLRGVPPRRVPGVEAALQ